MNPEAEKPARCRRLRGVRMAANWIESASPEENPDSLAYIPALSGPQTREGTTHHSG